MEGGTLWPVAEFCRVTPDADPLGVRGRGTIKDEQHVPAGGRNVDIWRCFDGTVIACARNLGEDDASSHQVAVGAGGSGDKRDPHVCRRTLEEVDVDVVSLAVLPILIHNGVCRLDLPVGQIRRDVDFNSEFFREYFSAVRVVGLGVGSRDKNAAVMKEDRLGVIHTSDDGFVELGETLANGKSRVVEESFQVWIDR